MGTKFTVFDNALNPERALPDMSNARQELAGIIYVSFQELSAADRHLRTWDGASLLNMRILSFSGNKCFGNEGAQKDDGCYSWNEQRQRASPSQTEKCKFRTFSHIFYALRTLISFSAFTWTTFDIEVNTLFSTESADVHWAKDRSFVSAVTFKNK